MENQDKFWVNDPLVLLNKNKIKNIWPKEDMTTAEKWNSITRMVILLSILGFILRGSFRFIIVGIVTLALIVVLYHYNETSKKKEGFDNKIEGTNKLLSILKPSHYESTPSNPLSNVLLPQIQDDPKRPSAPFAYTKDNSEIIENNTKKMIEEINQDNSDIDQRLFQDLGDNYEFSNSMRSFYSPANTTIPNSQEEFAKFCYGNMPSRKEDMSTNS